jgi:hypothetical protein
VVVPTRQRPKPRAPEDRQVDLIEGARHLGFHPDSLQRLLRTSDNPPPFVKNARGAYRGWISDLEAWAIARDQAS